MVKFEMQVGLESCKYISESIYHEVSESLEKN
jgi:hypothetical protein